MRLLGDCYKIGEIPLKGERHKMVTLCTSTAYAGCDFYSECASTYVICNSKAANMIVDIGTELKQIAGRQRLGCNPFRDVVHFVYNTSVLDMEEDVFNRRIKDKTEITNEAVEYYNKMPEKVREKQIRDIQRLQKIMQYGDDYVMFDSLSNSFVFNRMACLYERYAYELQRTYKDGICVKSQLQESDFDISDRPHHIEELNEQVHYFARKDLFEDKMRRYCEDRSSPLVLNVIEESDDRIVAYYNELGAERIKALGYKESALKNEIRLRGQNKNIRILLSQIFYSGVRMPTSDIKMRLSDVYKRVGVKKKAVAKDLVDYGYDIKQVKVTLEDGSRKNGYLIK